MNYSEYQDLQRVEVLDVVCLHNYVRVMLRNCQDNEKIYFSVADSEDEDYQLMTELVLGDIVWINPFTDKILFG